MCESAINHNTESKKSPMSYIGSIAENFSEKYSIVDISDKPETGRREPA
jgi:hypothetical protein